MYLTLPYAYVRVAREKIMEPLVLTECDDIYNPSTPPSSSTNANDSAELVHMLNFVTQANLRYE